MVHLFWQGFQHNLEILWYKFDTGVPPGKGPGDCPLASRKGTSRRCSETRG